MGHRHLETAGGKRSGHEPVKSFIVDSANSARTAQQKYVLFQNGNNGEMIEGGSMNIYNTNRHSNRMEKNTNNRMFLKPTEHKFSKAHTSPEKIQLSSSVKKDI